MTIDMSMRLTCGKMLPRTHIMRQPPPGDNNDDAGDNTGDNQGELEGVRNWLCHTIDVSYLS